MNCEQAYELMSARLDGALSAAQEETLRAHLEGCPACRALMETMTGLDAKVAALREPAPEGLKKGVLYRIDQATGKAKTPRRRWFGPGTALGAVAAVLVLLVGLGVFPLGTKSAVGGISEHADSAAVEQNRGAAPVEAAGAEEPVKNGLIPNAVPQEPAATATISLDGLKGDEKEESLSGSVPDSDSSYYVGGGSRGQQEPNPISETLRSACTKLSAAEQAAVLLYTEFDPESLFGLLKAEEPQLYALVQELEPVREEDSLRIRTDCGTVLAIQEWLLENLPQSELMAPELQAAETGLRIRMEALDPGSESLYRVISWAPRSKPIAWPEQWPEAWAARLRTQENWELFFPTEDFVPSADAPAWLVFALPQS